MSKSLEAQYLEYIFNRHRGCFSDKPIQGVMRRRDASEPDGGERPVVAFRCIKDFVEYGDEQPDRTCVSRGDWYPQDQSWDSFLTDEEFYAHYYVDWPHALDTTERQKLLQGQINTALHQRAYRYIETLAVRATLEHSRTELAGLLAQYRELFGSPEPEDRK